MPEPERTAKSKKSSQKGASGLGKPKKYYSSLKDTVIAEAKHIEDLENNSVNKENSSEISSAPCIVNSPLNLSPKKASHLVQNIPLSLPSITLLPIIQYATILPNIPIMAGQRAPTRIKRIVVARYGPLMLPMPLNPMLVREYQKYMPKVTVTEGVIVEEHLESFYSYANNLDISENDAWMRFFVQSLDGEARRWFREFPQRSNIDIEALDDAFLRQLGDKKDFLYYHIEFGNLKRENGELILDLIKV